MKHTEQPTVEDEIDSLYAAAAAVERGEIASDVAESSPDGDEGAEGDAVQDGQSSGADNSETETTEQDGGVGSEDGADDEGSEDGAAPTDESDQSDDKAKSKRQKRKEEALTRSWENADKRHREADQREQQLTQREQQILAREQQLQTVMSQQFPDDPLPKYSPDEIGQSLSEFIEEGDIDTAKQLVSSLVNKAKAARLATGPGSTQFQQQLEQVRASVMQANPELRDNKSELFEAATAVLSGDWKDVLTSHPTGLAAAVEVAKLQLQVASVSELEARVKDLETENDKLRKATQLDGTRPSRSGGSASTKPKSVEAEIADLYKVAERGRG